MVGEKDKKKQQPFNTDFISKFTFTATYISVNQLIKRTKTIWTITIAKLEFRTAKK